MQLNTYIIDILRCLKTYGNTRIQQQIQENVEGVSLRLDENNSVDLHTDTLNINGQNIATNIQTATQTTEIIDLTKCTTFLSSIADHILRINHIGISYACTHIAEELGYYQKLIEGTALGIYEEASNDRHNRWFFIKSDRQQAYPMFEIILTESEQPLKTDWIPHIQIDIDTTLTAAEIIKQTNTMLADHFISWQLDIPQYGVVLTMGHLGSIQGTNIMLGIGTNLRGKQTLKKLQ